MRVRPTAESGDGNVRDRAVELDHEPSSAWCATAAGHKSVLNQVYESAIVQVANLGRQAAQRRTQAEGRQGVRFASGTATISLTLSSARDAANDAGRGIFAGKEAVPSNPRCDPRSPRALRHPDRALLGAGKSPPLARRS